MLLYSWKVKNNTKFCLGGYSVDIQKLRVHTYYFSTKESYDEFERDLDKFEEGIRIAQEELQLTEMRIKNFRQESRGCISIDNQTRHGHFTWKQKITFEKEIKWSGVAVIFSISGIASVTTMLKSHFVLGIISFSTISFTEDIELLVEADVLAKTLLKLNSVFHKAWFTVFIPCFALGFLLILFNTSSSF